MSFDGEVWRRQELTATELVARIQALRRDKNSLSASEQSREWEGILREKKKKLTFYRVV